MTIQDTHGCSFSKKSLRLWGYSRSLPREHKICLKTQFVKIQSDNGSEFKNSHIDDYCDEHGIKHELSSTYTPKQNGVVERKNKTLITLSRSVLDEYGTPERFWAEAVNTACYASNSLHRLLKKTAYELLVGRKPNV